VALYERTLRAFLEAGWLPLIDVGVSLARWPDPSRLVEGMDRAGVALAAVTAPAEAAILEAARRHPARLIPLTSAPGEGSPASLRRQIEAGAFGIGVPFGPAKEEREALEALLRLAEERRVPLVLRMEPEDGALGRLERQMRSLPGAPVVWAEAGLTPRPEGHPGYGHALLRALSLRHPNLFFTLTQAPPAEPSPAPRARRVHLYDPGGGLSHEWRALLDARNRHFLAGSSPEADTPAFYAGRMEGFRKRVLDALSPASRHRLAYQNAWRLLTGEEWRE